LNTGSLGGSKLRLDPRVRASVRNAIRRLKHHLAAKEAAARDLGLAAQTGFVTKALLGLFGSDRFRLAVSANGSTFFDGLIVDNATGIVDQPRLPRFKGYTNYDNYVGIDSWTKIGINNTEVNNQRPSTRATTASSRR
jgi:hypothetical protein